MVAKMVIQHNTDGRPCGWGLAETEEEAREIAERYWNNHKCYPGEERGQLSVHDVEVDNG